MNKIEFKGKEYLTRTFLVSSPEFDGEREYTISTESLYEALGDNKEVCGSEESEIDNEIYFYVEDDVINLTAEEICKNHLDWNGFNWRNSLKIANTQNFPIQVLTTENEENHVK